MIQAGQSSLWLHVKGLEAVKETALFFCNPPPAFKLQNAISGCIGTNVFLLVPVSYNVSKIRLQQPEKTISICKAVCDHEITSQNEDLTCSFPRNQLCMGLAFLFFSSFIDPFRQKEMVSYLIKMCAKL